MAWLARILRFLAKTRFRLLGHATIRDIPSEGFNEILAGLLRDNWIKTYEYTGHDAWIDHGCVILKKDGRKLKFEWDNWSEGSIEGKASVVREVAVAHSLEVVDEWRWSEYDDSEREA